MFSRLPASANLFSRNLPTRLIRKTLATTTAAAKATPKERKKKGSITHSKDDPAQQKVSSPRIARELEERFGTKQYGNIVDAVPLSLLKRTQTTDRFYLASPEQAKTIAKTLTDGLEPDKLLVEVNPGMGLLTKELLKKTDNLFLYEADGRFEPELNKVVVRKPKVELKFGDFNGYWRQCYQDSLDQGNRIDKLLEGLPRRFRWKDEEVNFRLFSVVGSLQFFKSLIHSVASQKGLFGLGRCEMMLAVPPLFFVHLTCWNDLGYKLYRSTSVLFQIFFEHEFIGKVPRKDFLPWPKNSNAKGCNLTQYKRLGLVETDDLYLMRVVPRRNLFDYCLPDNLKLLTFFISQNMVSRKNRIIPALERWIPFCGARLILNQNYVVSSAPSLQKTRSDTPLLRHTSTPLRERDFPERMTIFTEIGELTPSQILTLFNEFISWPEFQQSPFLQSMEQYYDKHVYGGGGGVGRLDFPAVATAGAKAGISARAVDDGEDVLEDEEEHLLAEPRDKNQTGRNHEEANVI